MKNKGLYFKKKSTKRERSHSELLGKKNMVSVKSHWKFTINSFIYKMQMLQYKSDEQGVCNGIACVAAHAMLLNKLKQFDKELWYIKKALTKTERSHYIIRSIFDAVEVCQSPEIYPHLFSNNPRIKPFQHPLFSLPLVQSSAMEKQGGIVFIAAFSGVYGLRELEVYFQCIRRGVEKFPHPMAMFLADKDHIVVVSYSPVAFAWFLVDSNNMPSKKYNTDAQLAKMMIDNVFCVSDKAVITGMVVASSSFQKIATRAVRFSHALADWKRIQAINVGKKKYFQQWLSVSIWFGCIKEVKALLNQGVNPNGTATEETSPIADAARRGYFSIVLALIAKGAEVNNRRFQLFSPLYGSMTSGNDKITQLLLRHGATTGVGEKWSVQSPSPN